MDTVKMISETVGKTRQRRGAPLILELDLTEGLMEGPPTDPVTAVLARRKQRLAEVLDKLRRAHADDRVRGLLVKIGTAKIGLAMVQELRQAVGEFRAAGKLAIAWSESFGEFARGTVPYYLATAFDRICLQPSGDVGLTGVSVEAHFARDALTRIGVEFQLGRRHEYKTSGNTFTESGFTEAHRESVTRIAQAVTEQIVAGIAEGRRLAPQRVRELIDRGPLSATEALEAGLVDRLAYRDEVYYEVRAEIAATAGADPHLLYVSRYGRMDGFVRMLPRPGEGVVALIYGTGPIRLGRSRGPLLAGIGADTVCAALRAAVKDDKVKAIVFRVDSPGGSYVASDSIWRHVQLVARSGKPILVSMGNVAASGGYYVSMAADVIVAQPGTLTGSIGVLGGKAVIRGMLDRIGVTSEAVDQGATAGIFSITRGYSEAERERVTSSLDRVYADFTAKVSEARKLPEGRIDELARGRVWTGAEAYQHGLVDELGGLSDTLALARKKAGLPVDAPVRAYPGLHPLERLRPPESSEDRRAATARLRVDGWAGATAAAYRLGLPPYGPLALPGWWRIS